MSPPSRPEFDARIAGCLRCPVCAESLAEVQAGSGRALRCARSHSFDIAREGYVNLQVRSAPNPGDTAAMAAARHEFLGEGHFDFIASGLVDAARGRGPVEVVLDAGAGTGYYLASVLDACADAAGLALDLSRPALRRAARAHARSAGALSDIWQPWPLRDAGVDLILNVFAPRNPAEFHRVLRPGGTLLVVSPYPSHLAELVGPLSLLKVGPEKEAALAASLGSGFEPVEDRTLERTLALARRDVRNLVEMGPSAWHVDRDTLATAVASLPEPLAVTASVHLAAYRRL